MTKIAILTQPLGHNYGGLLQAFALQAFLKKNGCEVTTIDRNFSKGKLIDTVLRYTGRPLKKILILFKIGNNYSLKDLHAFREKHIQMSKRINTSAQLEKYFRKSDYDLVIVGSDQVWRPKYSPEIEDYFLGFLENIDRNFKLVSYAASFGVDKWEFTELQTNICKNGINKFDGVSVREESAVKLCKDNFDVDAQWVVDPTLLLDMHEYSKLIPEEKHSKFTNIVLNYVLNPSLEKQNLIKKVSSIINKENVTLLPKTKPTDTGFSKSELSKYPAVEEWLIAFRDSDFIITDSFHGCVFSIIFNKKFIALANFDRGLARLETLLKKFNLEDRLVTDFTKISEELVFSEIDWCEVNTLKKKYADDGATFLEKHLN